MLSVVPKESFRCLVPRTGERRLVCKNGDCNISRVNIDKRGRRFLIDIFTTIVDIKWRWILLIFTMAFTLSWIIFALVWWLIAFSHLDVENYGQQGWKPCVEHVRGYNTKFEIFVALFIERDAINLILSNVDRFFLNCKCTWKTRRAQTTTQHSNSNVVIILSTCQRTYLFRSKT